MVAIALLGACADVRPPIPQSAEYAAVANDTEVDRLSPAPAAVVAPASAKTDGQGVAPMTETGPVFAAPAAEDFRRPVPALAADAPASRYAALSDSACSKELAKRGLPFEPSKQAASGVSSAWRFTGPLHGIRFVTPAAPSLFGVLDCRLALSLDDMAAVLARHGVVTIRVDNFYRPNAHLPGKKKKSQHASAMAIDMTSIELGDGTKLTPPADWHAPIGSKSCGPDAVLESTEARAVVLRDMVCDVARAGVFHHLLTPSYDAAHQSHFHFDVAKDAKSVMVR
jgi:hypothetical protein